MMDMILFIAYLTGVVWGPWLFDKIWFWSLNKRLDGYEPKFNYANYDTAEIIEIEADDTKKTIADMILERIYYAIVWFSSMLWIGGVGCLIGIVLAVAFGHKNLFIGVGVALGTIIGAIYPFVFFARYCRTGHSKQMKSKTKSISQYGQKKITYTKLGLGSRGSV